MAEFLFPKISSLFCTFRISIIFFHQLTLFIFGGGIPFPQNRAKISIVCLGLVEPDGLIDQLELSLCFIY